jgi:glycosyltransferase involved in cell wall biosynthesis
MKLSKISVITPSFNQAQFIRATIDSVLSQDYPALEYLVVDGGSTDGTLKILKSYGARLEWVSEPDHGQSDAINKGLKLATGDILCYLNSDDVLAPGALKLVGEYFASHPDCDWVTGDCNVIGVHGEILVSHNWLIRTYKRILLKLYSPFTLRVVDNMLPQPSTFWSRRAYKQVGEFNVKYHYVMDYDYWLRLSKYYRPHDLGVVLASFRAQPDSKSETSRDKLMAEGVVALRASGATDWELWLHRRHSNLIRFIYNLLKK